MLPEKLAVESEGRRIVYVLCDPAAARYEPEDGGQPVQATGSVWVRFGKGEDASARAADIERAGYRVERIPGYAPHAAFVRGEDVAASLANLDALRAIDGVEHVEPELLKNIAYR